MKKIIALVMGIAFAFGTTGFVAAQTPAPKTEEKKADDSMKKEEKTEKKASKKKGGPKKEEKTEKKTEEKKKYGPAAQTARAPFPEPGVGALLFLVYRGGSEVGGSRRSSRAAVNHWLRSWMCTVITSPAFTSTGSRQKMTVV